MTDAPKSPLVIRPRRLRVIGIVAGAAVTVVMVVGWLALPREIRALFTPSQVLTLLGVLAVIVFGLATMAASYVKADEAGLRIRNGLRRYEVPWSRVHKILLRPGDPWAQLLVKPADGGAFQVGPDAEKRQLMGIQATDGATARAAVQELRRRQQVFRAV